MEEDGRSRSEAETFFARASGRNGGDDCRGGDEKFRFQVLELMTIVSVRWKKVVELALGRGKRWQAKKGGNLPARFRPCLALVCRARRVSGQATTC